MYDLFPALRERSRHRGDSLSGGEQQMLAVARAMVTNPDLILMDELFEGLAPAIIKDISGMICGLRSSGLSVLLVEQNTHAALRVADQAYIISRGKIVCQGAAGLLQSNERVLKHYIGL